MTTARSAVLAGAATYVIWGLVPLVFQAIGRAGPGPWEILSHRVLWGALATAALLVARRGLAPLGRVLSNPRTLGLLSLSAVLIAINWGLFIWAVNSGRTLQTSLGYYITPLISMAAGALIFRERIDRYLGVAMGLAAVGVVVQAFAGAHVPWVALAIAFSFGGYGVVRKRVEADAQPGFLVECLVLLIPAAIYLGWLGARGEGHFGVTATATVWLVAAGPITALPLVLFAWAARRLPLSLMGFLQFLSPTISLVIGVMEGEPFSALRALSFLFIWAGAAVYVLGMASRARAARPALAAEREAQG